MSLSLYHSKESNWENYLYSARLISYKFLERSFLRKVIFKLYNIMRRVLYHGVNLLINLFHFTSLKHLVINGTTGKRMCMFLVSFVSIVMLTMHYYVMEYLFILLHFDSLTILPTKDSIHVLNTILYHIFYLHFQCIIQYNNRLKWKSYIMHSMSEPPAWLWSALIH